MNLKKLTAFASAAAMSLAMLHSYPAQTFEIDWNFAANAADGVAINAENFPDEIFRSYVSDNFDTNSDGALSTAEIANVTGVYVAGMGISSLEGIEHFSALYSLYCDTNQLTTLDVSHNTKLVKLLCYENQLTTLEVGDNDVLETLWCSNNQLTTLDVSNNIALENLDCNNNQLDLLIINNNTKLEILNCFSNQLTALDVSSNTAIEELNCQNNKISVLDLSNNKLLKELNCSYNRITELNLGNNKSLKELYCSYNKITTLDVTNNTSLNRLDCSDNELTVLDISNITYLEFFTCDANQLTSIDISNNLWYTYSYYHFDDNVYDIGAVGEVYYLNLLPGNFDVTKASNWQGATYENGVLTNFVGIDGENKVTYYYNVGQDRFVKFTLTYTLAEEVSGIIGTGLSADVSLEDNMYIADDISPVISFTASVDYRGNEYFLDISDYIIVSANTAIVPSLDTTTTDSGDELLSPFDLYWSAYNAGTPTTEFTCEYIFDMSRIDELFCELTAISGLSMNYEDNADYFECILYEDGEAILIGDEPYTCKIAQRGDANLDHAVDTRDAASMAKYCSLVANGAENPELSATDNELAQFSGDVNCDGVIDTKDAAIAAKYASLYAVYESDNIASIYYNIYAEMGIIE